MTTCTLIYHDSDRGSVRHLTVEKPTNNDEMWAHIARDVVHNPNLTVDETVELLESWGDDILDYQLIGLYEGVLVDLSEEIACLDR